MYEPTALFWYKSIFTAELLIAEWLFTFRLKKRKYYPLRFAGVCVVCEGVSFALPILGYNAFFSSVLFLSIFAVTVLCLKFCYNESWLNIFFCAIAAYTVQHVSFEVYNFLVVVTRINEGMPVEVYGDRMQEMTNMISGLLYFDSYAIVYWLTFLIFGRMIRKDEDLRVVSKSLLMLSAIIVLVAIVFNALVTYYSYDFSDPFYISIVSVLTIICCLLALCIQFGLLSRRQLKQELDAVNLMWEQEKKQYAVVKDNIDYINVKCHDLKHQIRGIGRSSSLDEQSISEIENVISIYDSVVKTGCEALDVIITEKTMSFSRNGIKLTCIADGEKLNFMSETDIYSLFGNAIDNAAEALMKVQDKEKRVIGLIVRTSGTFLSVHIYNYCPEPLKFADGLPITTKADKRAHGYGVKSIRMITEKYGGEMSMSQKDDIFNLDLLFPLDK